MNEAAKPMTQKMFDEIYRSVKDGLTIDLEEALDKIGFLDPTKGKNPEIIPTNAAIGFVEWLLRITRNQYILCGAEIAIIYAVINRSVPFVDFSQFLDLIRTDLFYDYVIKHDDTTEEVLKAITVDNKYSDETAEKIRTLRADQLKTILASLYYNAENYTIDWRYQAVITVKIKKIMKITSWDQILLYMIASMVLPTPVITIGVQ